jgi:hypothetical protein
VIHCGHGAGFALETLGELLVRDLDGYVAAEARVAGALDFAHTARA